MREIILEKSNVIISTRWEITERTEVKKERESKISYLRCFHLDTRDDNRKKQKNWEEFAKKHTHTTASAGDIAVVSNGKQLERVKIKSEKEEN